MITDPRMVAALRDGVWGTVAFAVSTPAEPPALCDQRPPSAEMTIRMPGGEVR